MRKVVRRNNNDAIIRGQSFSNRLRLHDDNDCVCMMITLDIIVGLGDAIGREEAIS
jgi:hypothetical protein